MDYPIELRRLAVECKGRDATLRKESVKNARLYQDRDYGVT